MLNKYILFSLSAVMISFNVYAKEEVSAQQKMKEAEGLLNDLVKEVAKTTAEPGIKVSVEEQKLPADMGKEKQNIQLKTLTEDVKKLLEKEVASTRDNEKDVMPFPQQENFGELELAPLPTPSDSQFGIPAVMEPSVSRNDLPSEQLLGKITPDVFQELAELERGNVFLKLQMQKEQLKKDLEKIRSAYRQERLDEIAKREDIVRKRIRWWQEQEELRSEIEAKKAEAALVEKQIVEAEENRDKLRKEALAAKGIASDEGENDVLEMTELYTIVDIKGVAGKLVARIRPLRGGVSVVVKEKDTLPSGYEIIEVTRKGVIGRLKDKDSFLPFVPEEPVKAETSVSEEI